MIQRFMDVFSKTNIANILGVIIIIGAFLMLYLLIVKEVPAGNKEIVNVAIGFVLGGAVSGVVGYFYGASKNGNTPTN